MTNTRYERIYGKTMRPDETEDEFLKRADTRGNWMSDSWIGVPILIIASPLLALMAFIVIPLGICALTQHLYLKKTGLSDEEVWEIMPARQGYISKDYVVEIGIFSGALLLFIILLTL